VGTLHRVSAKAEIGVSGLATMGRNLARNLARHGHVVAVHNRSAQRTRDLVENFSDEGTFVGSESAQEFVDALERPRRIVLMVPAGAATDAVIDEFTPLLEHGDVIIDAGNAHFLDTRRREKALSEKGLNFVGMGVSGGEEGALNGPSIMPGGPKEAYDALGPLLEDIAAKVDGEPCCTHIGADGAGHFVKMVHNGIEYADMQLIAEAYDLLRKGLGLDPAAIADTFRQWNAGRLDSYLMEISSEVLSHVDADSGRPFVDVVADEAEQKGTGRWTVQGALELGVPVTGIGEAVFSRSLSGHRDLRDAARDLPGTSGAVLEGAAAEGFADDIEQALYASKIVAYAQPRASTRSRPAPPSTTGRSTSAPWPPSGAAAASSAPASSTRSPPPTGATRSCPRCSPTRRSARPSPARRTRGAAWWPWPRSSASRRPASRRRWPTTTRCAPSGCRRP
jgi:6-phosphogluconate dehydrogenase